MYEDRDNTHMASEFYVFSMLHRIGANAFISMGNKKVVDIIVKKGEKSLTIDVKGLQAKSSFPVNNYRQVNGHYIVFVSYDGKFDNVITTPKVYIVPSNDLEKSFKELNGKKLAVTSPKGAINVSCSSLEKLAKKYQNNWKVFKEGNTD